MLIEYKNGKQKVMRDAVAKVLIAKGMVKEVETKEIRSDEPKVEISERTGLPKRQYNRRDMKAEG